jgi:hypothetical protein
MPPVRHHITSLRAEGEAIQNDGGECARLDCFVGFASSQ